MVAMNTLSQKGKFVTMGKILGVASRVGGDMLLEGESDELAGEGCLRRHVMPAGDFGHIDDLPDAIRDIFMWLCQDVAATKSAGEIINHVGKQYAGIEFGVGLPGDTGVEMLISCLQKGWDIQMSPDA
jgi:hypothetical protein